MPGNETPFAARVAVVLKLPSTQHNTYRWGAPREPSKRARWPDGRADGAGTLRAANLGHAAPATTCLATKHLSLHVLLCSQGYQVPGLQHVPLVHPGMLNARAGPIPLGGTGRYASCSHPCHAAPATTCLATKHLSLHVLLLFSNYQVPNTTRTAGVRPGNPANARAGPMVWARHGGTRRAANLGHAAPATTCLATKHLSLHVLLLFSNYQVPNTTRTAGVRPGIRANARAGPMVGRDIAVRVVQPTLAMLHQRRHAWQRNTFRCTCCCCSQITKYPTQHVPLGCAQGTQLTRALARWSGATGRYASCSQPWPCCTSDDMPGNETPFAARVAVVLKLPSTQHNTYRWGAPREPS